MTKLKEIYKCEICGNIVEVLHTGQGELVCCGQPMVLNKEKSVEMGHEKHVPIVEKRDGKILVKVGQESHPMKKEHFIEWIEIVYKGGKSSRVFLKPDDKPQAEFVNYNEIIKVREYCNVHGLWINN